MQTRGTEFKSTAIVW